jgi:outer membrane protein, heavy metal efflux system
MKPIHILGIGMLILLTSCATTRTTAIVPESRPILKQIAQKDAQIDNRSSEVEDPKGTLTLKDALRLALLQNPQLAVFALEIRAREAASLQASLLPNPEFSIETENFTGSGVYRGVDATETTISLGQLIELGGKRAKRTELAALHSDLAAWDFETMRLEVYSAVMASYTQVMALQEKVKLDSELLNIAKQLHKNIEKRVTAGRLSPAETARASVAVSNAEISLQRTKRQLTAARRQLTATWNGKGLFKNVAGEMNVSGSLPDIAPIIENLDQSPTLARWAVEMDRRRASLKLSEAMAVPDPNINLAFRRINESDDNAFVAGVSIPIQLFDRNQGAIKEAEVRVKQGEWERKGRLNTLKARVESIYPVAEALAAEISALTENSIPYAEEAYTVINSGYQQGKFQLIDVLDAQRTLFEARQRLLESMKDYKLTITEIERITGQNLNKL